jgi:hypothetical protein
MTDGKLELLSISCCSQSSMEETKDWTYDLIGKDEEEVSEISASSSLEYSSSRSIIHDGFRNV